MTTATPTRTLADELQDRWTAAQENLRQYDPGSSGDPIADAMTTVVTALMAPWYINVNSPSHGESFDLAAEWSDPTATRAKEAGRAAFTEHVVPAIVAVLVERFGGDYPRWAAAHPDGGQVRADLAMPESSR